MTRFRNHDRVAAEDVCATAGLAHLPATDCFGKDNERRISGCTALIDSGVIASQAQLSHAYAIGRSDTR